METAAKTIPFGRPLIGDDERKAVDDVLNGPILTHGPRVKEFESAFAEFTGAEIAIATSNCAAALHLSWMAIGVGPGDEVLVPAQTHVATAHSVEICGAKPVFVDAEPRTGNMDLDQLEQLITPRTRGIGPVHYLGRPVDMTRLMEIARRHDLAVVEDCALSPGGYVDGVHTGLIGDVGCFSFYPVKHITTGEGGMVITRRPDLAERIGKQRAFGIDKSVLADRRHSGEYDIVELGLNYRLGEIGAAMGLVQMERLPEFLEARAANYGILEDGLAGVEGLEVLRSGSEGDVVSSHYCLAAILAPGLRERRTQLVDLLKERGVGTSVYYPKAIPDTTYYRERYGYARGAYPVASLISDGSIALPVAPHVTEDDAEYIVRTVKDCIKELIP